MLTAELDGRRVEPQPGGRALCPACRTTVLAKCGTLVTHHWAHESRRECDPWAEPDTEWHRRWQLEVPARCREVVIGPHRADIVTPAGIVVELQHSNLSVPEIREREDFYGRSMRWIWDCREAYASGRLDLRRQDGHFTFRWKHPRKSIASCRRPVLLDLGVGVLNLQHMYTGAPCGGWGSELVSRGMVVGLMNRGAGEEQLTLIPDSE